ncbi:MAG: cbb3-type cytochrome c oxidase subunit II [Acetobacteraceae bacterium]
MKLLGIAGGSTLIYLVLATAVGILPGIWLSRVPPGPNVQPLTQIEAQGRDVYVSEGCGYCHTQQVRPLPLDSVFGRPSAPGDLAYQTPELLGSERTGPDLTSIGVRQPSSVWQYMHLYNPRSVVPQSIMPSFPFLFDVVDKAPEGETPVPLPKNFAPEHGVVVPNADGKALVAYLLSLKQAPLPGAQQATATTAPPAAQPASSATAATFNAANGATLFSGTCAACHGAEGKGVPGVFPPLVDDPVVNNSDPTEHIQTVLQGAHGRTIGGNTYAAEMPPFAGQLSDQQAADIIDHERTSWGNHGSLVTAADVAAIRAGKKPPAAAPTQPTGATKAEQHPAAPAFNAAEGATLFASNCAACHGAEGKGVPGAFPPLVSNPVVTASNPADHIETVLNGAHGRTIDGQTYAAMMPPFAGLLSDQQIVEIINHERTSWGNHAPLVTVQDVAAARAKK